MFVDCVIYALKYIIQTEDLAKANPVLICAMNCIQVKRIIAKRGTNYSPSQLKMTKNDECIEKNNHEYSALCIAS